MLKKFNRSTSCLSGERGFTLVEISFALLIAALGFVTVLSMQSSAVDRVIRDKQRMSAMLLTRELLALLEEQMQEGVEAIMELRIERETPISAAESLTFELSRGQQIYLENLQDMEVSIEALPVNIPLIGNSALRRMVFRVDFADNSRPLITEYVISNPASLPGNESGETEEEAQAADDAANTDETES